MLRRGPALPVTTSTLVSEDALANMPDDASVRVAHADLPGLTWLLDTPPRGYVVDRLRLKPGASVTAGLRPEVSGAPWLLVQAYAPEPWADKRAKVSKSARRTGHDVTVHADERVLVVGAASDRRLPMLAGLRPDTGEPVRVGHVLGTATTLSYNPNRRWVGRIDTPGGERILARMHAAGHAGAGGLDDTTASPVSLHPWLPGSPWVPRRSASSPPRHRRHDRAPICVERPPSPRCRRGRGSRRARTMGASGPHPRRTARASVGGRAHRPRVRRPLP